jgi:hypothetical protein
MSRLENVALPRLSTLDVQISPPAKLALSGTVTSKDPAGDLGPFTRAVHQGALADGLSELRVDVTGLKFVNSSAIRVFVDWATWVKQSQTPCYRLHFITSKRVTWQKTCFMALLSLAEDALVVEQVE